MPPGTTTLTLPITIIDDDVSEGDETAHLKIRSVSFESSPTLRERRITPHAVHVLTIVDDEPPIIPDVDASFASASQNVAEDSGTASVTVNLSSPAVVPVTVNYTVGGSATPGTDYAALSGSVTVLAGNSAATIPVSIVNDNVNDPEEKLILTLAAGQGYRVVDPNTHTLTIDRMPRVRFPVNLSFADEDAGRVNITVSLSPPSRFPLTLKYWVTDTATPGEDYVALPGTLSVPANAASADIAVDIIDDTHEDSFEVIAINLKKGDGYVVDGYTGNYPWLPGRPQVPVTSVNVTATHKLIILNDEQQGIDVRIQTQIDDAEANGDTSSANLWRRALAVVRGKVPPTGLEVLTEAEARKQAAIQSGSGNTALASLWLDVAETIKVLVDLLSAVPEVAIAGTSSVTEGADAVFTLTASPLPASALTVTVSVAADGDFGDCRRRPHSDNSDHRQRDTDADDDERRGRRTGRLADRDGERRQRLHVGRPRLGHRRHPRQ